MKFFPGVKAYRKRLVTTDSFENTQNILNDVREEYKQHLDKKPGLGELDFLKDSVEKKED
ncbi:MAG: hypothetical protein Q8S84_01040 [bacterium]|nr:hypothetical protein [bacterium]MDP3380162.1 hypothetical protein [bacterium]